MLKGKLDEKLPLKTTEHGILGSQQTLSDGSTVGTNYLISEGEQTFFIDQDGDSTTKADSVFMRFNAETGKLAAVFVGGNEIKNPSELATTPLGQAALRDLGEVMDINPKAGNGKLEGSGSNTIHFNIFDPAKGEIISHPPPLSKMVSIESLIETGISPEDKALLTQFIKNPEASLTQAQQQQLDEAIEKALKAAGLPKETEVFTNGPGEINDEDKR